MKVSFVLNCGLYSKTESGFCLENATMHVSNSENVRKWKTWHCLDNGREIQYKNNSYFNFY